MRIGGPPAPAPAPTPTRYKSPGEDLFDAMVSEMRGLDFAQKMEVADALERGDYGRAPTSVRRLFENAASEFTG